MYLYFYLSNIYEKIPKKPKNWRNDFKWNKNENEIQKQKKD